MWVPAPPVTERLNEPKGQITDLERRIERQVANLEAEDSSPGTSAEDRRLDRRARRGVEERRERAATLAREEGGCAGYSW